jgi:hypothetical protein
VTEHHGDDDVAAVDRCSDGYRRIRKELSKVIVGQDEVIEQVLIAMFSRGHALLEGVPGLAKTLLVSSLAKSLDLTFKRIQFTPDLMPSDVTGAEVIQEDPQTRERAYRFLPGPIFANLLLADEINRTPPKTQAAMLEAMQERQISAGGRMHALPAPFFVLATQNPLEQEGTYPLPEAQLDRFLLYVKVDYPSGAEEWEIARRVTGGQMGAIEPCMPGEEIVRIQQLVTHAGRGDRQDSTVGHARPGQRSGARIRLGFGPSLAPRRRGNSRIRQQMGELGRWAAGRVDAGHLRESPRGPARALPRNRVRRASGGQVRAAAPDRGQLRGSSERCRLGSTD